MRKFDPLVEIELGIRGDTAASLGQAGRKLERAVNTLLAWDHRATRQHRKALLFAAADALWAYVVQREAVGITDNDDLTQTYAVPAEVSRLIGARPQGCD